MSYLNEEVQNEQNERIIRLFKWILYEPGLWYIICTPDDKRITPSGMQALLRKLEGEGFYEIIFMLIMLHREKDFMKSMFFYILTELASDKWKSGHGNEIIRKAIEYL